MSKRKPARASKHTRSPKMAAKAQRATQAIVRSPKDRGLRSVGAGFTESPPKRRIDSRQEAFLDENPAIAIQDDRKLTMTVNDSNKGFDFSSAMENVLAYQTKLMEMARANVQFAVEFTQRLAAVRSPAELLSLNAELTSKGIAMFLKYSKEMAGLSIKR